MNSYVYILSNHYKGTLYIGVTSNLVQRVYQHRAWSVPGFSARYKLNRLVFYEQYGEIREAIAREKQLKKWKRDWKIDLIEAMNPGWDDLYASIL